MSGNGQSLKKSNSHSASLFYELWNFLHGFRTSTNRISQDRYVKQCSRQSRNSKRNQPPENTPAQPLGKCVKFPDRLMDGITGNRTAVDRMATATALKQKSIHPETGIFHWRSLRRLHSGFEIISRTAIHLKPANIWTAYNNGMSSASANPQTTFIQISGPCVHAPGAKHAKP